MAVALAEMERPAPGSAIRPQQAKHDDQVLEMWLHGRSRHTQRLYRGAVDRLLDHVGKQLREISLGDLQAYSDSLEGEDSSRATYLACIKSLFRFCSDLGYTAFNIGTALRLPKTKNTLAERILTEEQVMRMITLEPNTRNRALLRLLYSSGGRVSEIRALKWRDLLARDKGTGQVTLYGKGGKTRAVLLSVDTWKILEQLRGNAGAEDPVFRSRKGGHLDAVQILRIVRAAGKRAGVEGNVSPHWFRHSHASHALDRKAPIHVVQATLGHASLATTSRYVHARPTESSALYLPM